MKKCKEYDMLDKQIKAYCGAGCRSLFFRNVLVPDWWRKEMCEDGSLTFSMAYVVAQHLGVSLMPLVNGGDVTIDGGMSAIAYKKRCDDDEEAVDRTSAFMRQLAISTLSGIGEQKDIPCKPEEMRGALLRDYKEVDFLNLLDFCWSLNIPVLSISSQMPHSAHWHRPQAAVFKDKGKYCIFILEKSPFNAKPLFLLAHELGHIASGHLDDCDGCHIDDNVAFGNAKECEKEANDFALKLLGGDYEFEICPSSYPKDIADWAIATGKAHNVNPGHLILRDAFVKADGKDKETMKRVNATSTAALKILNQADETAPERLILIRELANILEDDFNDETYEFIARGTGLMLEDAGK